MVLNIPRLGLAHDRVQEERGVVLRGRAHRQLEVRAVQRVPRLERNDVLPAVAHELGANLDGGAW